jgi:3(or 17)beta-hydroxysteroid dehydrogenase
MGRVQDKVALVTGGASGIGEASARLLAHEGAKVVLSDLQRDAGERIAEEIRGNGGAAFFLPHDVTDEEEWQQVIAATVEEYGGLDVLVNNAGIGGGGVFIDEMPLETWRQCLAVNLDGVFLGIKHGIRAMQAKGRGSIINTSSILGFVGLPRTSNYVASKGGVRLLTKAAAIECAARALDIRINSIHQGFIETPLVNGAIQQRGPEMRAMIESLQPTGAMGAPEDIANGVLYLASDESRFMTGSELVIDGGYLAR